MQKKAVQMMAEKKAQKEAKKKLKKAKAEARIEKKKKMDEKYGTGPSLKAYVGGRAVDARELEDMERNRNSGWGSMYSSRDDDDRGW